MSVGIVPRPKSVQFASGEPVEIKAGLTAIVVGDTASEPEQYAAELLQRTVKRRFGQQWPIVRESDDLKPWKTLIVLGQSSTCRFVYDLTKKWDIDLTEKESGRDAYAIRVDPPLSPLRKGGQRGVWTA